MVIVFSFITDQIINIIFGDYNFLLVTEQTGDEYGNFPAYSIHPERIVISNRIAWIQQGPHKDFEIENYFSTVFRAEYWDPSDQFYSYKYYNATTCDSSTYTFIESAMDHYHDRQCIDFTSDPANNTFFTL